MTLSPDFQFSQSNLYDFETCAYRFKLRYLDNLKWPSVEAEPIHEAERLAKLGTDFHLLIHQHLQYQQWPQPDQAEIALEAMLADDESHKLQEWWRNYLAHRPKILDTTIAIYPEYTFSTPLRGYRLTARFDVLAIQADGNCTIIDWKTAQKKHLRERLEKHPQTLVYPYVLAMSGAALLPTAPSGEKWGILPDNIKMMYWYPAAPYEEEIFHYSTTLFKAHENRLEKLIEQIKESVRQNDFPMTAARAHANIAFTVPCANGARRAGPLVDLEEDAQEILDVSAFDWEQIAEIQF